jgi:L-asparagine transporter-like permease
MEGFLFCLFLLAQNQPDMKPLKKYLGGVSSFYWEHPLFTSISTAMFTSFFFSCLCKLKVRKEKEGHLKSEASKLLFLSEAKIFCLAFLFCKERQTYDHFSDHVAVTVTL